MRESDHCSTRFWQRKSDSSPVPTVPLPCALDAHRGQKPAGHLQRFTGNRSQVVYAASAGTALHRRRHRPHRAKSAPKDLGEVPAKFVNWWSKSNLARSFALAHRQFTMYVSMAWLVWVCTGGRLRGQAGFYARVGCAGGMLDDMPSGGLCRTGHGEACERSHRHAGDNLGDNLRGTAAAWAGQRRALLWGYTGATRGLC